MARVKAFMANVTLGFNVLNVVWNVDNDGLIRYSIAERFYNWYCVYNVRCAYIISLLFYIVL